MATPDEAKGRKLLTAVERLVASNESLRAVSADVLVAAKSDGGSGDSVREAAAAEVVRRYSNRAALVAGAASLPSLVPGAGLALGLGATLAELTLVLKVEVEMTLVLLDLYGFDIDDPGERQIGFLLASVGTYDAGTGSNFLLDIAKAEGVAIWNYAPRRMARLLVTAMAVLAAMYVWRGLLKLVPFLGLAVGTSLNKILTTRVGERVRRDLATRKTLLRKSKPRAEARGSGRRARRR